MKAKASPKKWANHNDDQQDQSCRKLARLAAGPSTLAITTQTVRQASDSDGSSEEEVVPVALVCLFHLHKNHQQVFLVRNTLLSQNTNNAREARL